VLRVTHLLPLGISTPSSMQLRTLLVEATQEVVSYTATTTIAKGRVVYLPRDVEVVIAYYAEESATKAMVLTTIDVTPPGVYFDDWQSRPDDGDFKDKLERIGQVILSNNPWMEPMARALNKAVSMHICYNVLNGDVHAEHTVPLPVTV